MISKDTIALIKERTDIVAIIGESVRLARSGRSFKGLCPFHKEKSPSFHVHPDRGFFHCFGCQESGSVVDFVMKTNGLDFRETVTYLAERAGIPIEESKGPAEPRRIEERDELFAVNALAVTYFESMLFGPNRHPLAKYAEAELKKRGMPPRDAESEESEKWASTLSAFRMGYAPAQWDGLLQYLRKQGASQRAAERVGLLVARTSGSGLYDRFRHRLVFAIIDPLARILGFSARALEPPTEAELPPGSPTFTGEPPAKYINSPESLIYTKGQHLFGLYQAKRALHSSQEAVLVEGNFDVVTLHARGIDRAVAPLGTAFTVEQAKLLKRFAPRVVVLFDADGAGRKATRASRQPLAEGGLEARVGRLPAGMDPDDFVRKEGVEALERVLKGAPSLLEHLLDEALSGDGFRAADLTEQASRVRAATKLLSEENDPNLRLLAKRYADELARRMSVAGRTPENLSELERWVGQAVERPQSRPTEKPTEKIDPIALSVLGALIDAPELLRDEQVADGLGILSGDVALAALSLRRQLFEATGTELDPQELLADLPHSIQRFAASRFACPIFEAASLAKADVMENIAKLRGTADRQRTAEVVAHTRVSGALSSDEEGALLRELTEIARRKRGID